MAALLLRQMGGVATFFLTLALFGLAWTAWRLFRHRRDPDSWEGGLLWLMSFLVIVILLART